jgi:MOSC domain-containing protein YiiM
MSLDPENLPPGTRISIGETEIEVTAVPHLGCSKFSERFGRDAMVFVNDERGRSQNLRGINARVVRGGQITTGDRLTKI